MNKYFSERLVAFIDILGFRDLLDRSVESEDIAENLHNALKRIMELKKENEFNSYYDYESYYESCVEISTFSDSIAISYPIDYKGGLFLILCDLAHLQLDLAQQGVLIRGGITIGQLYHKDDIIYGPAFIEAYNLEHKKAIYPRIIIEEDKLFDGIIKTKNCSDIELEIEYFESCLNKDEDGFFYLDILRQASEVNDYYDLLAQFKKIIVLGLECSSGEDSIGSKYKWLKKYFNEVINECVDNTPCKDNSNISELKEKFLKLII